MKILYVTTVGITMGFFNPFIRELLDEGHNVDIATNESDNNCVPACYREWGCEIHQIDTSRSPLNMGNLTAISQIKRLVQQNNYDIVHCHTPVAAMCTRLACRKARKQGTKVYYTAHGFHFYKGAPFKNWMLYYPVEKICSYFTDVLITMNNEDYALAQKKMKAKEIVYVPGVGIDLTKFGTAAVDKASKREGLGVPENASLLLSVGELNENKNHETVIRAIADMDSVYYIIAGEGKLREYLQNLINEIGVTDRVKLLGYRNDIGELCETADIYAMPSFREGLSVALMEAMASGLPCVVSKIRGNTDLIDENGGALFDPHNVEDCRKAIQKVLSSENNKLSEYNREKIKSFSLVTVSEQMKDIIFGGGYSHLTALMIRQEKRDELGIPLGAKHLLNIGELIPRKNQETLIRAVSKIDGIYLTIAGKGALYNELSALITELGVVNRVKLLGYRSDISELCKACDIFAFSSFHEGLPVSVMEAMASGLPCVVSRIRGNTDLIDEKGGVLFDPHSVDECVASLRDLLEKDLTILGKNNSNKIEKFSVITVKKRMKEIYELPN